MAKVKKKFTADMCKQLYLMIRHIIIDNDMTFVRFLEDSLILNLKLNYPESYKKYMDSKGGNNE